MINPFKPMPHQYRYWYPFVSPFDPCPPIRVKKYSTPPQLFLGFQPPNLPQYPPKIALRAGTLWPVLFSPYKRKKVVGGKER